MPGASEPVSFAQAGVHATTTLLNVFYAGDGRWRACNDVECREANSDWGVDSATDALYLRWKTTHDPQVKLVVARLLDAGPHYPTCGDQGCSTWSDTPEWDAVTFMREYQVLDDPQALERAKAAYAFVERSKTFATGACPGIRYQHPQPSIYFVKSLETEANAVKAGILLYRATQDHTYLDAALSRYASAREYYLDADTPLYTVHVRDDGQSCVQQPHRFFASVNGDMIWNGIALSQITGNREFYDQALATAHAVDTNLSDERGIFANVQGENDVVEPLVEAMYELAANHESFAEAWVVRNAEAALSARASDGTFARFFDGPAQQRASIWESNGGLALEIAAASLDPYAQVLTTDAWSDFYVAPALTTLPATITVKGSGIALMGTLAQACQNAHVHVLIDGVETFDQTGLWQNYSMPDGDSVFFAWRWKTPGTHTITLEPSAGSDLAGHAIDLRPYIVR